MSSHHTSKDRKLHLLPKSDGLDILQLSASPRKTKWLQDRLVRQSKCNDCPATNKRKAIHHSSCCRYRDALFTVRIDDWEKLRETTHSKESRPILNIRKQPSSETTARYCESGENEKAFMGCLQIGHRATGLCFCCFCAAFLESFPSVGLLSSAGRASSFSLS